MSETTRNQPAAVSVADQAQGLREHYEDVSMKACHWASRLALYAHPTEEGGHE